MSAAVPSSPAERTGAHDLSKLFAQVERLLEEHGKPGGPSAEETVDAVAKLMAERGPIPERRMGRAKDGFDWRY